MSYYAQPALLGRRRSNDIPFPDVPPEKVILHLGRNGSDFTGSPIQWNEELVDTYGAFAPTSNTVTIPAGMNGKLVRLLGQQFLAQDNGTNYPIGTASKPGWPVRSVDNGAAYVNVQLHNYASGPFTPATGQTIQILNQYASGASLLNATMKNFSQNFLVLEELDANTARCVAYKTTPQSIPANTTTPVVFEALTENNTGEFALAPGGAGIVVPRSGYYRVFCNAVTETAIGTTQIFEANVLVDGVFPIGAVDQARSTTAYHADGGVSAGMYLAKSQVVSLTAFHIGGGSVANLQGTGFCFLAIEQLPAGMKRTIATTDGTQSIATQYTDASVQYKGAHLFTNCGTEIHNPAGANPHLFVCPAGCNRGRVAMNWFDETGRNWQLQASANGRTSMISNHGRSSASVHAVNMFSPAFVIAPGQSVNATAQFAGTGPVTIPAPNARKAMWFEACFWAA